MVREVPDATRMSLPAVPVSVPTAGPPTHARHIRGLSWSVGIGRIGCRSGVRRGARVGVETGVIWWLESLDPFVARAEQKRDRLRPGLPRVPGR